MQAHDTDEGIRILFSLKQSQQTFKLQATFFTEKHSQNYEDFQYIYIATFFYISIVSAMCILYMLYTQNITLLKKNTAPYKAHVRWKIFLENINAARIKFQNNKVMTQQI